MAWGVFMSKDIVVRLREAVGPGPSPGASGRTDTDACRELLERLYGFYAPLEGRLAGYAHWTPLMFHKRRKTPLLGEDLWNLSEGQIALDAIALCRDLPDVTRLPAAMGCVYAMESQTACDVSSGLKYFYGYGPLAEAMWQSLDQLIRSCSSAEADELMVEGAQQTRYKLGQWMSAARAPVRPRADEAAFEGFPRIAMGVS
jgi:heme oxygenase